MGHLGLGQPLNTLSGGENQRLKLAHILADTLTAESQAKGNLLILDEPGTGLHFCDIEVLLRVFDRLVQQGNTLVDDIMAAAGLPAGAVLAALTMLEVKGLLQRLPGKRVQLK